LQDAEGRLYILLMQDETPNYVEVPVERLRRHEAAAYARRRLGQSVKVNTLRTWPIPYRLVGRDAVYEIADLDRFIDARLEGAARRRPGPTPDFVAMFEERRRLIAGNGSEEEARLRALEYVAGVASRHFGCDPQTAVNLVRAKLKEKV
jgi:hypothetical protein